MLGKTQRHSSPFRDSFESQASSLCFHQQKGSTQENEMHCISETPLKPRSVRPGDEQQPQKRACSHSGKKLSSAEQSGFIPKHQPEHRSQSSSPVSTSCSKDSPPEMNRASRGNVGHKRRVLQQPAAKPARAWQGENAAGTGPSPAAHQHRLTRAARTNRNHTASQANYFHRASKVVPLISRGQGKEANVQCAPGSPHQTPGVSGAGSNTCLQTQAETYSSSAPAQLCKRADVGGNGIKKAHGGVGGGSA